MVAIDDGESAATDYELVDRYQVLGDESAATELYRRHKRAIYKLAIKRARITGAELDEALSHAHYAFSKSIKSFDTTQTDCKFISYLYRGIEYRMHRVQRESAIYVPYSAYRTDPEAARRARSASSLDVTNDNGQSFQVSFEEHDYFRQRERFQDASEELMSAMDELEPRLRRIVHWRFFEDLKFHEIGEREGITKQRAKQLLERALSMMRGILEGKNVDSPPVPLRSVKHLNRDPTKPRLGEKIRELLGEVVAMPIEAVCQKLNSSKWQVSGAISRSESLVKVGNMVSLSVDSPCLAERS